jgi:hypothetical protein
MRPPLSQKYLTAKGREGHKETKNELLVRSQKHLIAKVAKKNQERVLGGKVRVRPSVMYPVFQKT